MNTFLPQFQFLRRRIPDPDPFLPRWRRLLRAGLPGGDEGVRLRGVVDGRVTRIAIDELSYNSTLL